VRAFFVALLLLCALPALAEPPTFAELTRSAIARPGLLDTYETGDHLYLAIPADRLGRDLALVPQIERGIGADGLFGGLFFDRPAASLVAFERHGDRVFLVKRPARFTAPAGSAEAAALALSLGDSVLQSAPVLTTRPDGALVIDAYDWFVADFSNLAFWIRQGLHEGGTGLGAATLDKTRGFLAAVKAFPGNLEIEATLTLRPAEPPKVDSLPDARFAPLTVLASEAADRLLRGPHGARGVAALGEAGDRILEPRLRGSRLQGRDPCRRPPRRRGPLGPPRPPCGRSEARSSTGITSETPEPVRPSSRSPAGARKKPSPS
jgi:Domain of unknown function (DUF5117)